MLLPSLLTLAEIIAMAKQHGDHDDDVKTEGDHLTHDAPRSVCAACVHNKKPALSRSRNFFSKPLILFGERGGTRTLDPMIKSHVLYRLSYAPTCRAV